MDYDLKARLESEIRNLQLDVEELGELNAKASALYTKLKNEAAGVLKEKVRRTSGF